MVEGLVDKGVSLAKTCCRLHCEETAAEPAEPHFRLHRHIVTQTHLSDTNLAEPFQIKVVVGKIAGSGPGPAGKKLPSAPKRAHGDRLKANGMGVFTQMASPAVGLCTHLG